MGVLPYGGTPSRSIGHSPTVTPDRSIADIFVLVFFWQLTSTLVLHVAAGLVASYTFRAASHSWSIVAFFTLWVCVYACNGPGGW